MSTINYCYNAFNPAKWVFDRAITACGNAQLPEDKEDFFKVCEKALFPKLNWWSNKQNCLLGPGSETYENQTICEEQ